MENDQYKPSLKTPLKDGKGCISKILFKRELPISISMGITFQQRKYLYHIGFTSHIFKSNFCNDGILCDNF